MINTSLNRIRNEDILHLQREKNVATMDFSAGLSNNRILTRQFEFKSAEPACQLPAMDRFMAKGRKRLCENPNELFIKVKFE